MLDGDNLFNRLIGSFCVKLELFGGIIRLWWVQYHMSEIVKSFELNSEFVWLHRAIRLATI